MKYMGSKARVAKYIAPILNDIIVKNNIITYIEPFVGGANMIEHINARNVIGCDNNKYLIALWNELKNGYIPPNHITKEEYSHVRYNYNISSDTYEDFYIGCVGFLASYNGRFFDGGYSGEVVTNGGIRNYYQEAVRNVINQVSRLKHVNFCHLNYSDVKYTDQKTLIYCDPPYINTKQYNTSKNFNHNEFWKWVREVGKQSIILVSELQAPGDFHILWEQDVMRTINNNNKTIVTEKLFINKTFLGK